MFDNELPEEILENYRYAIAQAKKDPERYVSWIKAEVEICLDLINKFDKIHVMGALGARLIKASPNSYNQFLAGYDGHDKEDLKDGKQLDDEHAEIALEYVMSMALATPNTNAGVIPSQKDVDSIYEQLVKLQQNFSFFELSKSILDMGESDLWIRNTVIQDNMNIRGDGFHQHVQEIYLELFAPFDAFLDQFYGFNSKDIYRTVIKLDGLVISKLAGPLGGIQAHERFNKWQDSLGGFEDMIQIAGAAQKTPFQLFGETNPDVVIPEDGMGWYHYELTDIGTYPRIFWVVPETDVEERVLERLSTTFGSNGNFLNPPQFKAFIMNDSVIHQKPIAKVDGKYYHFSMQLAFRNLFKITEQLIKEASQVYYDANYRNNTARHSRDNFSEIKTRHLFETIMPNATFYRSAIYYTVENNEKKKNELDLLAVTDENIYVIEVKAGELNNKHRRGAMKGLKDRLEETINYGSFQCHRALTYINGNPNAVFEYAEGGAGKTVTIDGTKGKKIYKITVTFEHFAALSLGLKHLVDSGILGADYKWVWVVSLYDLMVFADLVKTENDFMDYLDNRLGLYDRNDVLFTDEIDILGFFLDNHFPLPAENMGKVNSVIGFGEEIDTYYTKTGVGMYDVEKPKRKT